jgi:hypothetical protein
MDHVLPKCAAFKLRYQNAAAGSNNQNNQDIQLIFAMFNTLWQY